jgi:ParB family chromosome partitioning protein
MNDTTSTQSALPTSLIDANPDQPRREFHGIAELAESVVDLGILQPLVVTQRGDRYLLVAGERRLRAARHAGIEEVPVVIRDLDDRQVYALSVAENIARSQMTLMEEADACRRLLDTHDEEEVARTLGKSESWVSRRARLTALTEQARWLVENNEMGASSAEAVAALDPARQHIIARRIIDGKVRGDSEIRRAAVGMWRDQQQTSLIEDDPVSAEERIDAVSATTALQRKVDRMAEELAAIIQTDERTLALAGRASAELAHTLDAIARAAARAANRVAVATNRNTEETP